MGITHRNFNTSLFETVGGGDPILSKHFFWFLNQIKDYTNILEYYINNVIMNLSYCKYYTIEILLYCKEYPIVIFILSNYVKIAIVIFIISN